MRLFRTEETVYLSISETVYGPTGIHTPLMLSFFVFKEVEVLENKFYIVTD